MTVRTGIYVSPTTALKMTVVGWTVKASTPFSQKGQYLGQKPWAYAPGLYMYFRPYVSNLWAKASDTGAESVTVLGSTITITVNGGTTTNVTLAATWAASAAALLCAVSIDAGTFPVGAALQVMDLTGDKTHQVIRTPVQAVSINRLAVQIGFGKAPSTAVQRWTNRGRTAAGVLVEWNSIGANVDSTGAQYPYVSPPWADIVETVGLRTWTA